VHPYEQTRYLSLADVIAIHQFVMEQLGTSAASLRDEGALESAILRPHMAAYYESADLIRQSALLAVGISQAQAFVDGNKRTAFAALRACLRTNGFRFTDQPLALAQQLEAVSTRVDSLDDATRRFEAWLRERVEPIANS
jgi:death-on-curing protein